MIGKVVRGSNVGGLLRYLYGPGRVNEHADPHLVAGFGDPQELEPDRRADGAPDLRRLTGLLLQPLAADPLGGCEKPVWHCSVRAAPGDRVLSDAEWGQAAAFVLERTGFAPAEDEAGVRWVAVRHAADHIHIVATLARQDGGRVRTWNDFFRVRDACRDAERRLGLTATAPADRTAAKRASRAETEQAARRGWSEEPRVSLRREVCTAAAGASSEREFFGRLGGPGSWSGSGTARSTPARSPVTQSAWRPTPRRTARSSGTEAGSSRPTSRCRSCGPGGPGQPGKSPSGHRSTG